MSYQPTFIKNISFGITRIFQNYTDNNIIKFIPKYLPVIGSFFGSAYNDTINRDQVLAFNTRWIFPKNHAEVYFEFGYNDAKDNFRDLMVDMSHSSGYIFGFKKLSYINKIDYLDFGAEVTRLAPTPSYLMRNAGNFYEHGRVTEGYTNKNQTKQQQRILKIQLQVQKNLPILLEMVVTAQVQAAEKEKGKTSESETMKVMTVEKGMDQEM